MLLWGRRKMKMGVGGAGHPRPTCSNVHIDESSEQDAHISYTGKVIGKAQIQQALRLLDMKADREHITIELHTAGVLPRVERNRRPSF